MNVVDRYQSRILSMYLQTHPDVDPDRVQELIQTLTERNLRDIPCVMDNNMTHETIQSTMINTFEWIEERSPIITGNGTFFKQHSEYLAPTVIFLETEQKNRKVEKKTMFSYPKGSVEYNNHNVAQGSIKVIMNSDYGGSGTPLSPFYSLYLPPATTGSAKNMTTTLICCLEFISGNNNSWAKMNSVNEMYDMIFKVLDTSTDDRDLIADVYSVDEVMQHLVSKTNNVRPNDIRVLKNFLSTLNQNQLTQLMLSFNVRLVLTKYLSTNIGRVMSYLKQHQIDVNNITKELIHEAGYGVEPPDEIKEDIEIIKKTVVDNCVYPFMLNDAEIRAWNMKRIIVCVTDTDSLMVQFASYLDEFQARVANFRDSCLLASAIGMRLFIEAIIPKMVEDITSYCNIEDKYYRDKFVFKNEFAFLAMTLFAKKMYSSSMFVQEGNPRDIHEIAVSGLSFKKRDSAEFLEPIMVDLYDKYILTADHIRVEKLLDEYYSLRDKLLQVVPYKAAYHKMLSVKSVDAYDASKVLPAQMRGAIVWNNMFPEEEILPMDRVTVIPLSYELMEKNSHIPQLQKIHELSLADHNAQTGKGNRKPPDPYISLPESYKDIPDWLTPAIDPDYVVDKLLAPFKQLLGLFDVVIVDTKGGILPSRMIYI